MRKLLALLTLIVISFSCQKDDNPKIERGQVQLSITEKSVSNGRTEVDEPSTIIISISTQTGENVLEEEALSVARLGDGFIIDPILLEIGSYALTKFLILNDANEVIYATPKEGSSLASFVDQPLPLSFTISADEVTELSVEVIETNSIDPEDLGYASISFDIIPTIDILVSTFANLSGGTYGLTESLLTVKGDGDSLFSQSLGDSINVVKLRTDFDLYSFTAILNNGQSSTVEIPASEIEAYQTKPLDIKIGIEISNGVFALVSNQIVKLDLTNANASSAIQIADFPDEHSHSALTYNSLSKEFLMIQNTSSAPTLVRVTNSGNYIEVGRITYNGVDVAIAEGLAHDSESNTLYATVSLNGGVNEGDFWSESLMSLNPENGEATFLTEIITSVPTQPESDTDDLIVRDGILYLTDSAPPGADFTTFYSMAIIDINQGTNTTPTQIFTTSYRVGGRIAKDDNFIYLTSEKSLYKLDSSSPTSLDFVGTTHDVSEFDGEDIVGVVYID